MDLLIPLPRCSFMRFRARFYCRARFEGEKTFSLQREIGKWNLIRFRLPNIENLSRIHRTVVGFIKLWLATSMNFRWDFMSDELVIKKSFPIFLHERLGMGWCWRCRHSLWSHWDVVKNYIVLRVSPHASIYLRNPQRHYDVGRLRRDAAITERLLNDLRDFLQVSPRFWLPRRLKDCEINIYLGEKYVFLVFIIPTECFSCRRVGVEKITNRWERCSSCICLAWNSMRSQVNGELNRRVMSIKYNLPARSTSKLE